MAHHVTANALRGHAHTRFTRTLRCYSSPFLALEKPDTARVMERSDKCILYSSLVYDLQDVLERGQPLVFEVINSSVGREGEHPRTHVGVLEFSGEAHGVAYLPAWVAHNLCIEDGMECTFKLKSLPRLKYLRLALRDHTFVDTVADPRGALEEALRGYTAVTVGDELVVHYADVAYGFKVLEVKPENPQHACCLVGADCELVFDDSPSTDVANEAAAIAASLGGVSLAAGGIGGSAATAVPPASRNVHRPLAAGEKISDILPEANACAYFTISFKHREHALRLKLTSNPIASGPDGMLKPATPAIAAIAAPGRARAFSGTGRAVASDSAGVPPAAPARAPGTPLVGSVPAAAAKGVATPLLGSGTPKLGGMSAAEVSAEFLLGPAAVPPPVPTAPSPAPDGSSTAAPAPAPAASMEAPAPPATCEADIFVSTSVSKPTQRAYTWADYRATSDKEITISHQDGRFPHPNDLGASVFYVAVIAYGGPTAFTISCDAVPGADVATTKAHASQPIHSPRPAAAAAPDSAAGDAPAPEAGTPATASTLPPPVAPAGHRLCENCGSAVPDAAYALHVPFCRRNAYRCNVCDSIIRQADRAVHVHCDHPGCKALCDGAADRRKHVEFVHSPWPCELCGEPVLMKEYEYHAEHVCRYRRVDCTYCKLAVPWKDLESHEAMCGGRTVPCDVCGRLIPRKKLDRHRNINHKMGAPGMFSGMTPETPFIAAAPSGTGMPDFSLDAGPPAATAQPRRGPTELTWNDLMDEGEPLSDEDEDMHDEESARAALPVPPQRTLSDMWAQSRPPAHAVECPSCHAPVPSFDEMQVHMITACAKRGTPEHAALLMSLFGVEDAGEPDSAAASGATNAAATTTTPATEDAGASIPADVRPAPSPSSYAAAAARGASVVAPSRRRVRWQCVKCDEEFDNEDDAQIHVLTVCTHDGGDEDAAMNQLRRVVTETPATEVAPPPVSHAPVHTDAVAAPEEDTSILGPHRPIGFSVLAESGSADSDTETDEEATVPFLDRHPPAYPSMSMTEDEELARAIAASMAEAGTASSEPASAPSGDAVSAPVALAASGGESGAPPAVASTSDAPPAVASTSDAPPTNPTPSTTTAAPAPAPAAAGRGTFACQACGRACSDIEALQMHMLTECEHAEENARTMFA